MIKKPRDNKEGNFSKQVLNKSIISCHLVMK